MGARARHAAQDERLASGWRCVHPAAVPLISVVIPSYNRLDQTRRALRSILDYANTPVQPVVVDDGSTDETRTLADEFAGRITYLRQENAGPSVARNTGIAAAEGEYVAFLDSDDLWLPHTIGIFAKAMAELPAMIIGHHGREDAPSTEPMFRRHDSLRRYIERQPTRWQFYTSGVAVRRDVLRQTSGFPPHRNIADETHLWLQLIDKTGCVEVVSPPMFVRDLSTTQLSRNTERFCDGVQYLLDEQRQDRYPGGDDCRFAREAIITLPARVASTRAAQAGRTGDALRIYFQTIGMNRRLCRWKYLAALPLVAAVNAWRKP